MKLAIHYLKQVGIAVDLQSIVFAFFFILFIFILYVVLTGNKKEYKKYGSLPLEEN